MTVMPLKLSVDAKALGAFVEYTLKPIIEDTRDLIDMCEGKPNINQLVDRAYRIFMWQQIGYALTSIIVTGIICLTAYFILSPSLNIHP